jgi:hypothetical protein
MDDGNDDEMVPLNQEVDLDPVQPLDYEEALTNTIDPRRSCMGKFFQIMIIFVTTSALNSSNFLILGLPFMKSEPQHLTCKSRETGEWAPCTKKEVCSEGLGEDEYEIDREDYNYIENWNEQAHMLCENK